MTHRLNMRMIAAAAACAAMAFVGCGTVKDCPNNGQPLAAANNADQAAKPGLPVSMPAGKPVPAPRLDLDDEPATQAIQSGGRVIVWDSFEGYNRWTVEAADDPAKLAVNKDTKRISAGRQSLRCEFTAFRKNQSHLRREVFLDLSQMNAMLLDVYAETDGLALSVAFRVTAWQKYYESYKIDLHKGWNKDIEIDLQAESFNMAERGAARPARMERREDVRRISLIIHHKPETKGVVFFDNIRFRGWPRADWDRRGPRIIAVVPNATVTPKYGKLELQVQLEAAYGSYFDPAEIDITATFVSPEKGRFTAHGFLDDFTETDYGRKTLKWLVRFAPCDVGRWEYNVLVRTRRGEALSPTQVFYCTEAKVSKGFVRRSKIDGRYFEFDNHDFFYPIGQNVCWATDYEPYFKKMAEHGENFARIWMCPWHLPLELRDEVGQYSLESARGMDRIIELAEQYDIYLQIVIEYHGMLRDDSWAENPYNQANGGPCKRPQDFYVDPEAKRLFKQRLRYIAARWAWSTHVMAWELLNEADLTKYYDANDVVRWHNEMARALRSDDAQKHMVTTSCYNDAFADKLWALGGISYAQLHRYTPDVVGFVTQASVTLDDLHKPYFIGEFGRGWTADADQTDLRGLHLHAGLWASFMTTAAGAAMPWWWDTYIDPQDLYHHFAALAAFAKREDRRGRNYTRVRMTAQAPGNKQFAVRGLLCPTRCLLWLFDPQDSKTPSTFGAPRIPAGAKLRLTGMWPGKYKIEYWNTYQAARPDSVGVKSDDGTLEIVFPKAKRDIACKVIYQGATMPSIHSVGEPAK